jgi:trehalose 6-phosphate phosphatase
VTLPGGLEPALAALAGRRPLLVASDYDGVLARLRDEPSEAVPEPGAAEVLARLAAAPGATVALVSGRGVDDLRATSGLRGPFHWVGSHGAEVDGPVAPAVAERRDRLAAELEPLVAGTPGARLEVKPASVAVHVRQVADRAAAAALLARVAAEADPSLTENPARMCWSSRSPTPTRAARCSGSAASSAPPACSTWVTTSPTRTPSAPWETTT